MSEDRRNGNGSGNGSSAHPMASMPAADREAGTRDPEEIRQAIEAARAQIATSVACLKAALSASTDWRAWYRRRPGIFIGLAVAAGFWLGTRRVFGRMHI